MNYEEACEALITASEARAEIDRHDTGRSRAEAWAAFIEECGDHPEYLGKVVLDWLGY